MIHDLDILFSLVHSKVKRFQAVGMPLLTHTSDMANVHLEFENGCRANLTASRVSNEKVRKTRIFQPDGIFSIDYLFQKLSFFKKAVPLGKEDHPEMVMEDIPVQKIDPLEAEIHSFLQSVRNRRPVRVSGSDGKRALEMALQIIQKMDDLNKKKK
jgi:predicted dehydrogenase